MHVVQSGMFAGTKLHDSWPWDDGNKHLKIAGTYEQHLHGYIARLLAKQPNSIWNIGCAEGFYAVGIARKVDVPVYVMEPAEGCRIACQRNAELNGVTLNFTDTFNPTPGSFVLMDCEGHEREYLKVIPDSDLIVELHDFHSEGWGEEIYDRMTNHDRIKVTGGDDERPDGTFWIVAERRT